MFQSGFEIRILKDTTFQGHFIWAAKGTKAITW